MTLNTFFALHPLIAYGLLAVLSLTVGSLLNVIIYRLPLMLEAEWKAQYCELLKLPAEPTSPLNLFLPRSFCPTCKTQVRAWHNIPLFSYVWLRGRCHFCAAPIAWHYPLIELLTMLLSVLAAWRFGFTLQLVAALPFIWILISLFFIDLKQQLLPDSLTLSLLWLGLIANTQSLFTTLPDAVLSAAAAYLSLWLFIQLYYWVTGKIGMGHGDFKLFAAFGAWFGWVMLPLILLMASLAGAVIGTIYLKIKGQSKDCPLAFGPYLCVTGLIVLFAGDSLVHWYLQRL